MSQADADVYGVSPNASAIVIGLDSGTIVGAPKLNNVTPLPFTANTLTIPAGALPKGDSPINIPIVFAPGDPDANITVVGGPAKVNAPATLDATVSPGGIDLFGI